MFWNNNEYSPKLLDSVTTFLRKKAMVPEAVSFASVAFRPEAVSMGTYPGRKADKGWQMKTHIAAILPTGPEWILQLEAEDMLFFARLDSEPAFRTGDTCSIEIDATNFLLFDATGNLVIVS